jgi:regulator of sirC expression with transglutaminase-like and TPR domain
MKFSSARQYFYQEIQQSDENIDLAKAALYIAQEEYPSLDPKEYLNTLDTMAAQLKESLPSSQYPLRIIQSINKYLYDGLGFSGNTSDYYDPCNSFLNDVIQRRMGIPITLSVVYMELAKRVNFPMVGVGMPGHFLIRPDIDDMEIFVDPFNRGEVMFTEDCQQQLSQIYGQSVMQPAFLGVVSHRQILMRILNNLKIIYLNQQDLERSLSVIERILMLFPDLLPELRDRGLLYYRLGYRSAAEKDFTTYLAKAPHSEDTTLIRHLLKQLEGGQ